MLPFLILFAGFAGMVMFGIVLFFVPLGLWVAAWSSGAPVSISNLIAMRLRRVSPHRIVNPRITALKAGLNLDLSTLEAHFLAGGNVDKVVSSLISAEKANIPLDFNRAAAIDLAGRDVLEAVHMSVRPKVITTKKVTAMAKDGIQLIVQARVTVRASLDRLIGGAGEETVMARIGEGIVTTVGSAANHQAVLENPDIISKTVLEKGLDTGTAFTILSIDIADIDVGTNVGAKLQAEQAEADKQIAQAKAESRRALAVAQEQEQKAKVQEARAEVVRAEAQVPRALAQALESGNMGAMDYFQMKNVVADTRMRESLGDGGPERG